MMGNTNNIKSKKHNSNNYVDNDVKSMAKSPEEEIIITSVQPEEADQMGHQNSRSDPQPGNSHRCLRQPQEGLPAVQRHS
jgi:hypothetical protein